jgi:hypothetical protein
MEVSQLKTIKSMSHKHDNLLHSILDEAPASNIHWREIESLLNHLGTHMEPANGARFKVTLNGVTDFLHHPHHSSVCTRDHIKHLRAFLMHAGVASTANAPTVNEKVASSD